MKDYDRRQLVRMQAQVAAYKTGEIDINVLISTLEHLFCAIEDLPVEWLSEVKFEWGVLEQAYSAAVVRNESLEKVNNSLSVKKAIERIELLINEILGPN